MNKPIKLLQLDEKHAIYYDDFNIRINEFGPYANDGKSMLKLIDRETDIKISDETRQKLLAIRTHFEKGHLILNSEIENEIYNKNLTIAPGHIVFPKGHLLNERDKFHFEWTVDKLSSFGNNNKLKVFDVGCYDGWLDFLLIEKGFHLESCEISEDLVRAARNYAIDNQLILYRINGEFYHHLMRKYIEPKRKYFATLFYEVLEHLPIEMAKEYVDIALANSEHVLVSLPDQNHNLNPQHLWSPAEELITNLWHPDKIERHVYINNIPSNFLFTLSK